MQLSANSVLATKPKPIEYRYRYPFLFSFFYCKLLSSDDAAKLFADQRLTILIDSGGFSAKNSGKEIDIEEYMEFLETYKDNFLGYMALDKVGDPKTSAEYLKIMLREGFKPVPIHVFGDGEKRLDELFEISNFVALAGLRRPHRGAASKEYVQQKHRWAKGRRVHWLGYSKSSMLQTFRPFSCDTASWATPSIWGRVPIYFGRGQWEGVTYNDLQKGFIKPAIVNWFKARDLPLTVEEFADSFYWRKTRFSHGTPDEKFVGSIGAWSWLEYIREFETTFGSKIFLAAAPACHYMHSVWAFLKARGIERLK